MATQIPAPLSFGFPREIKYRYDVFLSFRGEDTRHSFTVPLYEALRRKGINAFIDDKKLGKGEEISPTLLKAIEKSMISVIVFSRNYATSTWCLEELAHIIWCKEHKNQLVMPIFYKVDSSDVQYQRNSFEEAMAALEDRFSHDFDKVQKWRSALSEAASRSALSEDWLLKDGDDEGVFIERIVEDVYARLPPKRFHNVDCLVGLEPRIEEMGREVVRLEAPLNLEKRSRLWHYEDALKVLRENLGSNTIKGIMLDPPRQKKVKWSGEAFEKMNDLRILIVRNVQFSIGPTYLPNSLRWLEWEEYPSMTLPTDFAPLELIFLKLPRSSFRLKEPFQIFANYLTHMDFSYCEFITEVPDVSQLQSLRTLKLRGCCNLIKIDDSVGFLSKMVQLLVSGCTKLSIFPREINMPSLERLDLKGCESLEYFPHVVGNMESPLEIIMQNSAIKELPPSIGNLSRLEFLSMNSCKSLVKLPTSLFTLPKLDTLELNECHPRTRKSLIKLIMQDIEPITTGYYVKYLYLANCGLLNEELVLILNCFQNLRLLDLSSNGFVSLPKCIEECTNMRTLQINNCKRLRDIPELPSKLHRINAENCTSLMAESLDSLYFQAKKELHDLRIRMPRSTTFPDWFNYCCEGGTLTFRACRNVPRVALAIQLAKANMNGEHSLLVSMSINGREIKIHEELGSYYAKEGHVLLIDLFMRREKEVNECMALDWNDVEMQITCDSPVIPIERCGVYVYKQQTNMKNVQFKSPLVSRASPKRRAIAFPPNEPPKKLMRKIKVAAKGKMNDTKKRTRMIKRHQTFQSSYKRKMVFPMGKLVWRFLYH